MSTAADSDGMRAESIDAVLNYTRRGTVRPRQYAYEPPPGTARGEDDIDPRQVRIHNGRLHADLGLDTSGFELLAAPAALQDPVRFRDRGCVEALYYPDVVGLLQARTGARKVVIFDHTLRDSDAAPAGAGLRGPGRRVHDDQTFDSAPNRVRKHLAPAEAEERLRRRFAIVNVWRPIGDTVRRDPLAMCDARSMDAADVIAADMIHPDWTGENYVFAHSPRHRWFWFADQTPAEATLLKIFDSSRDGVARLTAHTAFELPAATPAPPPRRSIEVRALLFW